MVRQVALIVFFLFVFGPVLSQKDFLSIKRTTQTIEIDGSDDDEAWKDADMITDFMQYFPFDSSLAISQTEIKILYDDNFVYIYAKMYNQDPDREYVTPSLRRDYGGSTTDGVSIILDTYQDRTNAFIFGINPFGVQREGLISGGGEFGSGGNFDLNWDNKWYSDARINGDHWTAEMAIPFSTLRFKDGVDKWFINVYRFDSEFGEQSTWSPIPRNYSIANLAFSRDLQWDKPLAKPGKNISIIPYVAFNASKNHEDGTPTETSFTGGGDAKVALTPALNLDLTVNPDFSQVEVDRQVTNLDRFEIFFPERRQFFLENADLFANFGSNGARPFFSRRIGIARDTTTGTVIQNPIYLGARMSGKIDNNWRVGLLTIQAAEEEDIQLPSTNYTVATVQRKIWARSNLGFIFINKQAFQDSIGGEFTPNPMAYNRTLGLDFNLATADNKWIGNLYYHQSFDEMKLDSTFSAGGSIRYATNTIETEARTRMIGANYNPEVGFVRRRDYVQLASTTFYNFYPSSGPIQSHAPGFDFDMIGNQEYGFLDWDVNLLYRINFRNTSEFSMRLRRQYTYLFSPFDPSGSGGIELPEDTDYTVNQIIARYESDTRKRFFFNVSTRSGGYFNGNRINLSGSLTYRYQPWGFASINVTYNRIRLPEPYSNSDLYLIGPRLDFTFSRNIFWTTFIQFNNQIENVNVNSRLQWRYAPVSDLFIVYTDNYLAGVDGMIIDFNRPKSRSLVIKLTYWLNL